MVTKINKKRRGFFYYTYGTQNGLHYSTVRSLECYPCDWLEVRFNGFESGTTQRVTRSALSFQMNSTINIGGKQRNNGTTWTILCHCNNQGAIENPSKSQKDLGLPRRWLTFFFAGLRRVPQRAFLVTPSYSLVDYRQLLAFQYPANDSMLTRVFL